MHFLYLPVCSRTKQFKMKTTKAQAQRRKPEESVEINGVIQICPIGSHLADVEVTGDFF